MIVVEVIEKLSNLIQILPLLMELEIVIYQNMAITEIIFKIIQLMKNLLLLNKKVKCKQAKVLTNCQTVVLQE